MDQSVFDKVGQWVTHTPYRSLDQAYQAAQTIQSIEAEHFDGGQIEARTDLGDNVSQYFQIQLSKQLRAIRVQLSVFRISSALTPPQDANGTAQPSDPDPPSLNGTSPPPCQADILEKLRFIDQITHKYTHPPSRQRPRSRDRSSSQGATPPQPEPENAAQSSLSTDVEANRSDTLASRSIRSQKQDPQSYDGQVLKTLSRSPAKKTGILPRSILRTVGRLRREFTSESEEEVISDFRDSRTRTLISLRFLLLLALLPIVFQVVSKNFLFSPIIDHFHPTDPSQIVLTQEYEERALQEFAYFQEQMEFRLLLQEESEQPTPAEREEILRQKATSLIKRYGTRDVEGIKNILADGVYLAVFAWLVVIGREEIEVLKSFIDQLIYGLSDSAKAFIIILFTDIFVGYHSPHGWEVLLEGVANHFGLPANREVIFAFIATFPVMLDTLFKYWIFRYLNQLSPSAVATYKTMND